MALPSQSFANPTASGQLKQKGENNGAGNKQKIMLLVGGGAVLSLAIVAIAVVGTVLYLFVGRGGGSPGSAGGATFSGGYAVVDSWPSPPAENAEDRQVPLDTEGSKGGNSNTGWTANPDPSSVEASPEKMIGALTPEPSLLLASLGGPYAVGVAPESERARRDKVLKRPDGTPGEVISIDKEPHTVLDLRTGKPAGQFPVGARIRFNCRLSPDGRYLASSAFETHQVGDKRRVGKDELVVWQRDFDQSACRWPLPGPVLWVDFIGPERLALYHITPSPQFVVLDVTKGTPVVTAPLPAEEFSIKYDAFNARKALTSYRVWTPAGAVSPGGKWIAIGGSTSILLVDAAGRVAGRLPIDPVNVVRGYLSISFNKEGSQLRALTQQGEATPLLRVWSLADGRVLHKKPCPFQPRPGENPFQDSAPGPAILDGPEPNSLIVGHQLFDLSSGQVVADLPYQPQRWTGPKSLLALGSPDQADNSMELVESADFVPRGKSLIVVQFDGEALLAKAPKPSAVAGTTERPLPTPAERAKVTAVRLAPPSAWSVKPGAEVPRPTGPISQWPHAFANAEAAVVTESQSWIRYDLNTGATIGEPIELWPGQPAPSERARRYTAALTPDGQKLALNDPSDRARMDVWDSSGKRLLGLRPYETEPLLWLGWSADGKLLTADARRLTGWDVMTGQAVFEVLGNFAWFVTAPGAEWVLATTPARHLFFVDAATGQCLGYIPASPSFPEHTLSPDGKTLLRLGPGLQAQAWDIQTGKRKSDREAPLVPLSLAVGTTRPAAVGEPMLGLFWLGPRRVLSHTKSPAEQQPRYYLYDLDAHTHTYAHATELGTFQNDSLGRAWMTSRAGGVETWIEPKVSGMGAFDQTLAFGPGTTVRVEVDVGNRENSRKTAEKMAESLSSRGLKIGRNGWVLKADHSTSTAATDLTDLQGRKGISVATLNIAWRLLDPAGNEAWKGSSGGKFDPFNSKYVVVGSRKTEMAAGGLGGGSSQIQLDYGGKDPLAAQVEEILEKYWHPGVPACLVKNQSGYVALPLEGTPKP